MHGPRYLVERQPGAAQERGDFYHPEPSQKLFHQMGFPLGKPFRPQQSAKGAAIRARVIARQMVRRQNVQIRIGVRTGFATMGILVVKPRQWHRRHSNHVLCPPPSLETGWRFAPATNERAVFTQGRSLEVNAAGLSVHHPLPLVGRYPLFDCWHMITGGGGMVIGMANRLEVNHSYGSPWPMVGASQPHKFEFFGPIYPITA